MTDATADAYYCEMVDHEGNRHWSDVMVGDYDMETTVAGAIGLAQCELNLCGMTLRMHPISLANPVYEKKIRERDL